MNYRIFRVLALAVFATAVYVAAQAQPARSYTRADFVKVEGSGRLEERIERALGQSRGRGGEVWVAWQIRAREGASYSPFGNFSYYNHGIRLERRDPPQAAIFLLSDASGSSPQFKALTMLNLEDPYVFEDRPVYWLGDADAAQSIGYLEKNVMPAGGDAGRGAVRAISVHDSAQVVPLLRKIAAGSGDQRGSAISALARIRTGEAAEALIALYDSEQDAAVKREIISALSRSRERKAADKLTSIARNDPDPKLRQRAIQRLASQ